MSTASKTALLYDYLFREGGAERVTLMMARAFPALDVFVASRAEETSFADLPSNVRILDSGATPLDPLYRAMRTHRTFSTCRGSLSGYRQVVYSGMHAPLTILKGKPERAILYCHTTPLPFVYDWYEYYLRSLGIPARRLLRMVAPALRRRFSRAVGSMDMVVANSEYVKARYQETFDRDAVQVVYPPCALNQFHYAPSEGYFLSIARLEPHKRVDIIVRAFLGMPDKTLVVASSGSSAASLKRLAEGAANIHFTEQTSHGRLAELMGRCIATIYIPMREHFGLSAVESLASGKPVIGCAEGALPEIIDDGRNGLLVETADPGNLRHAVESLDAKRAEGMRRACERGAKRFDSRHFVRQMRGLLGVHGHP